MIPHRSYPVLQCLGIVVMALGGLSANDAAAAPVTVDFNRDVRPILSNRCFKCHGPDAGTRKGGLRLDDAASAFAAGKSGAIGIVPHEPDKSEVIQRLFSPDADELMPPPSAKMEMTEAEREVIQRWVAQGAGYERHWAFVAPQKITPPKITNAAHPIDAFIREKLQGSGLTSSPQADKYHLIRRVTLDLTGLLPTLQEADAFLADTSPQAYEKLVDRLLASPHYGERWARRWLDLARYADTNGYEKDRERSMWPWRDWVIRALNADMPFDEFTIKQLAGDMLPDATLDDRIATGFHRNTMLNEEGGIDPLEFRYHAMTDRVATTGTTWLGLTVGCAQCHTHKYDPILHTEYFQLMAFLNNADEPSLNLPDPKADALGKSHRLQADRLLAELSAKWPYQPIATDYAWQTPKAVKVETLSGEMPQMLTDQSIAFNERGEAAETYIITLETDQTEPIHRLRLDALRGVLPEQQKPGRTPHGNFVLNATEITAQPKDGSGPWQQVKLVSATANAEQPGYPVSAAIDGKPATGWAVHESPKPIDGDKMAEFYFDKPVSHTSGTRYQVRLLQTYGSYHTLRRVKLSLGHPVKSGEQLAPQLSADEQRKLALDNSFDDWLEKQIKQTAPWTLLVPAKLGSNLPILTAEPDGSIIASGDTTKDDTYILTFSNPPPGLTALRLDALPDSRLPANGPGLAYYEGPQGDFFVYEISVKADGREVKLGMATSSNNDTAKLAMDGDAITGWSNQGAAGKAAQAIFHFASPLPNEPVKELTVELRMGRHYPASLGKFKLSVTTVTTPPPARVLPDKIEPLLARQPVNIDAWPTEQRDALFHHFLLTAPELAEAAKPIHELLKPVRGLHTLVMKERDEAHPRTTVMYQRGEYLQPADQVSADVPAFLPPMPAGVPKDRLHFARWLVSREHPLTARVTVNRHWQAFFGTGLVKTLDDFGYQGETPSHPKLLDWLATYFMDHGWSQKQLLRLIVTSETYQQDSRITPKLIEADPQNRLLARGPRQRVEGEMVRDLTLQAAGLLSYKVHGPPVRPPQSASVTENAYGGAVWNASTGEDRYRRALYTFAKRTAPFATFQTFDAPTGEACIARREVSNTPLQSLVLLNDEVFVDTARALARLIHSQAGDVREKVTFAFRRCLTRPPTEVELNKLTDFYTRQLYRLKQQPDAANALMAGAATADEAAWMTLARVLLNLDETISK